MQDSSKPAAALPPIQGGSLSSLAERVAHAAASSAVLTGALGRAMRDGELAAIRLDGGHGGAAAAYTPADRTIHIDPRIADQFTRSTDGQALDDALVVMLARQTSMALSARDTAQDARALADRTASAVRDAATGVADLTAPMAEYLTQKRHQETEASRMAWNALASRVHGAGAEVAGAVNATLERMATASSCIRKVEGAAEPAVSGLVDERGMVGAGRIEAMARCEYDAGDRHRHAAGALAIVEQARRPAAQASVRLDLGALELDPRRLQDNGLDFGQPGRQLEVIDPSLGRVSFHHTAAATAKAATAAMTAVSTAAGQVRQAAADAASAGHADGRLAGAPADRWMHRLGASIQDQLPAGTQVSTDRVAQLAAAAHRAGMTPDDPLRLECEARSISLCGRHPAHVARVDLSLPPPPAADSLAAFDTHAPAGPAAVTPQHDPAASRPAGP